MSWLVLLGVAALWVIVNWPDSMVPMPADPDEPDAEGGVRR